MTIIHLITQMEAAGAQGAAVRNSRLMLEKGHDSKVVFLYKKREVYFGEDIICLFDKKPENVFHFFLILKRLVSLLVSTKNVKLMCYTHYANIIGAIIGRLCFVKRIVISHRNPSNSFPKIARLTDKIIGTLGFYNVAICVSDSVYTSFASYPMRYQKNLLKIYNGIDLKYFDKAAISRDFLESRFIDHMAFKRIIITTGRLHHQKNQLTLIEAMKSLRDCLLVIAGEGELRNEFENYISIHKLDNVKLIGELAPNEVREFLACGDIFAFPSKYEAFGFSLVEAMAVGLPVVVSDIPVMHEITGSSGIFVDTFNVNAWIDTLGSLTDENLVNYSKLAKEQAKLFSLENMVLQYMNCLEM